MNSVRYLAELTVYDPGFPGARQIFFADGTGFVTKPTDAVASTVYQPKIAQPINVTRAMFGPDKKQTQGNSQTGYGELVLNNADKALDYLNDYSVNGRAIRFLHTEKALPAAYADFTEVLSATMEQLVFDGDLVRVRIRDLQSQLDLPLQTTKYIGAGLGTLEGAADIAGKVKPIVFGRVQNMTPVCVETAKRIYQVSDSALRSIDVVYDRGVALLVGLPTAWDPQTSGFGATDILACETDGAGTWCAAGKAGKLFVSTDNGVTWVAGASGFGADDITCLNYYPGTTGVSAIWGIGGTNGKVATASNPAGAWTLRATTFGAFTVRGIAFGYEALTLGVSTPAAYAVGDHNKVNKSTDNGATWAATADWPVGGTTNLTGVAFNLAATASASGYVYRFTIISANGTAYQNDAPGFPAAGYLFPGSGGIPAGLVLSAVKWINGVSYLGATNGTLIRGSTVIANPLTSIAAIAGYAALIILIETTGAVAVSKDGGLTWTRATSGFVGTAYGLASDGATKFMIVGSGGELRTSVSAALAYASSADLLDDTKAPAPGTYKVFLNAAGSYFRLGADPSGLVTTDATEGTTLADRTTAQVFKRILARKGAAPNAGDITALDLIAPGEVGVLIADEQSTSDALDQVASTPYAWWGVDRAGAFRIQQFTEPTNAPVRSFKVTDLLKPLARLASDDPGQGVPNYKQTLQYSRNWTVQSVDVATSVLAARRLFLEKDWRDAVAEDDTVLTSDLNAGAPVEQCLFLNASDAQMETTRRLALRKVRRDPLVVVVSLTTANLVCDTGATIELVNPRFGSALVGADDKRQYVVTRSETNAALEQLTLYVWGPNKTRPANRITRARALRITSTGAYRVTSGT